MIAPLAVLASFGVSLTVTGLLAISGPVQPSGARSNHVAPTPISGGLGAVAGCAAGLLVAWFGALDLAADPVTARLGGVFLAAIGLGLVGAIDDLVELSARLKFLLLALLALGLAWAAGAPAALGGLSLPPPFGLGLAAGFAFVLVNAVNFMDGSNGLIAGVAVCVGLAAAAAGAMMDVATLALFALIFVAAWLGYSPWNARTRARVFMGDAGSLFAGGVLAGLILIWVAASPVPGSAVFFAPLGVAALLGDVLFTLIARARRGAPLMQAHREHAYQALIAAGRSHLDVAAGLALRTGLYAGVGLGGAHLGAPWPFGVAVLGLAAALELVAWRRAHAAKSSADVARS